MVPSEPPYPLPPRYAPADLGQRLPCSSGQAILSLLVLLVGLAGYWCFSLAAFTGACVLLFLTEDAALGLRVVGFIVCIIAGMVGIKGWLPRRLPLPSTATIAHDQPTATTFIARIAHDLNAPTPTLWFNSGTTLQLDAPLSIWRLVRGLHWELHVGLWLWQTTNLSEFKALLARTIAPLARGRRERLRQACALLLDGYLRGADAIDDLARSMARGSGLARMVRGCYRSLTFLVRWNALLCQRLSHLPAFELANDRVAVRICGSDSLVHAIFHADFAALQLQKLDDELLACRREGVITADLYAHQPDAIRLVHTSFKDDTIGTLPTLRGNRAGKYIDVYEPNQSYLAALWHRFPPPAEREADAKREFIVAEIDERPAHILLTNVPVLRVQFTKAHYHENLHASPDLIPLPPTLVQQWVAITPGTPFAPKYGGLYDDGRLLEPGTKQEREAALLTDEWSNSRLLSAVATLYTRVAPVVQRWQSAKKSLRKLLRKTTYRPTRRDRLRCDELDDERVKTGKWLAAIDQRAYVVYVHMAARLPDLQLHDELLARYRSVLRFQVFVADAREFRDRTAAYSERLTSTFSPSFALRRDAAHEFNRSREDFAGLLADAAEHNDPLLLAFTEGIPLERFLYAHDGKPTFKSDRSGRRLTHAWDEVVQKADWLHYRNVTTLIQLHERIQQSFTGFATQNLVPEAEPQIELIDDEPTLAE